MGRLMCILFSVVSFTTTAQQSGGFEKSLVYTLGRDTNMLGNVVLDGNDFRIEVLTREYSTVYKAKGTLNDRGELVSSNVFSYPVKYGTSSKDTTYYELTTTADSTITVIRSGTNVSDFRFPGKGIINNMIGHTTFFLLPFWGRYSPPIGDSLVTKHMWWGAPKRYVLTRNARDKMRVGSTLMGFLTLNLNETGDVISIDAVGSSLNVIGHLGSLMNMDSLEQSHAEREYRFGPVGTMTEPDTVEAVIGGAKMEVTYNRPSMRSRKVFGNIVPYGRFWRTGANQATTLSISKTIYFGTRKLPAGKYSVFTLPTSGSEWIMMLNSEVDIWGTDYDPTKDVLRVPMKVSKLESPVEKMTIELRELAKAGEILVSWENTQASASFTVK